MSTEILLFIDILMIYAQASRRGSDLEYSIIIAHYSGWRLFFLVLCAYVRALLLHTPRSGAPASVAETDDANRGDARTINLVSTRLRCVRTILKFRMYSCRVSFKRSILGSHRGRQPRWLIGWKLNKRHRALYVWSWCADSNTLLYERSLNVPGKTPSLAQ